MAFIFYRDAIHVLKAFVREVNFFLQGGDQSEGIYRKQGKIRGKGEGTQLSYFSPRITGSRVLMKDIVPRITVLSSCPALNASSTAR